jgi:hypothetical protein
MRGIWGKFTPLVVRGSEGDTREWNSPWLETASALDLVDILAMGNIKLHSGNL